VRTVVVGESGSISDLGTGSVVRWTRGRPAYRSHAVRSRR